MFITGFAVFAGVFVISGTSAQDFSGLNIVKRTLNECSKVNESYSCISDKVGKAIERTIDWDVPLIDGVTLARNKEKINHRDARILGSDRLKQAIFNFLDTHVISLDMGGARSLGRRGGGGGGGGFMNKKGLRREKKYMSYAFMVLLGIFGLTGPLVMKVLGLMAAKALLAAKAALIIVGSVALKKLFEKDRQEPVIKVHTVDHDQEDEHDRISKYGYFGYGYGSNNMGQSYNNPYSNYYEDYYSNSEVTNNAKVK